MERKMIDERTYKDLQWHGAADNIIKVGNFEYYIKDIQSTLEELIYTIEKLEDEKREIELDRDENYRPLTRAEQVDQEERMVKIIITIIVCTTILMLAIIGSDRDEK